MCFIFINIPKIDREQEDIDNLDCFEERVVQLAGTYFTLYTCSPAPHNNPGYP